MPLPAIERKGCPILGALCPKGMAAQIMLLVVVALISVSAVFGLLIYFKKDHDSGNGAATIGYKHALAVRELNDLAPAERAAAIETFMYADPELYLEIVSRIPEPVHSHKHHKSPPGWPFRLGPIGSGIELVSAKPVSNDGQKLRVPHLIFQLSDGQLVKAVLSGKFGPKTNPHRPPNPHPDFGSPFFLPGILALLIIVAISFWILQAVVRPLSQLSSAASTFGEKSVDPVPVEEVGPREVRAALAAFNRMQQRINETVHQRTRTLAAISHDFRTPLTRLRLRSELISDENLKQRNLVDLELMEGQLNSALDYLKSGTSEGPKAKLDLSSLLASLADQNSGMGFEPRLVVSPGLTVLGNYVELMRAFCNIVDNAHAYSNRFVEISAISQGDKVRVDFADHGPGIAADQRERMVEPFERGDSARTLQSGQGFGLGLPTCKAIVEAHGGEIALDETPGGGLTVRVTLPSA